MLITAALSVLAIGVVHPAKASADPTPSCDATTCTVDFGTAGTTQAVECPRRGLDNHGHHCGRLGRVIGRGRHWRSGRPDGGHGAGVLGREPLDPPRHVSVPRRRLRRWGRAGRGRWTRANRWVGRWRIVRVRDQSNGNAAARGGRRRGRRWRHQRDRRRRRERRLRLGCNHHQPRWHRGRPGRHPGRRRCGRSRQPGPLGRRVKPAAARLWRQATPAPAAVAGLQNRRP